VASKPDMTPVSDADVACEQELRRLITQQYPNDTIVGEEFGGAAEFAGRQWIIDPIDGTKNFVRGVPVWATLIALLVDGVPKVGVISAPVLGRRWWAATGHGAFRSVNNVVKEIRVSNVSSLENASISFSSLEGWQQRGIRDRFLQLTDDTWRLRGFGGFFSCVPGGGGGGGYRGGTGGITVGFSAASRVGDRGRRAVYVVKRCGRATWRLGDSHKWVTA